jgi:hypothetical protein
MAAAPPGATRREDSFRELSLSEILSLRDWYRFVPETIGLLVVLSLVPAVLPGGTGGANAPHPFWIPVLLMAGHYGIMGGLFSAIAAGAALYVGGLPVQSAAQDFYAYAGIVAAQPSAWFGTALVLGGLRTLHIHHQSTVEGQLDQARAAAADLADGLERALQEIGRLDERIAADASTLASVLHGLAKLDMSDTRSLVSSMADAIRYGVGASSFAVYLLAPNGPQPCLGVLDGTRLTTQAVPPLAPEIADSLARGSVGPAEKGDSVGNATGLIWEAIRTAGSAEPLGIVACSRLMPSRDGAIARRRLNEICRVLAVLLSRCPDSEEPAETVHSHMLALAAN